MTRYRRHPELRLTALDGEGVVLHLGSRTYFSVSGTGLDILEALIEPRTEADLVALLTAKYDVTEARAADSVRRFLERCRGAGLVEVEADA